MAVEKWAMMTLLVAGLVLQSATSVNGEWFNVGDKYGWTFPANGNASFFNDWASEYEFHVNDTLFFAYEHHSVLEVTEADYESCTTTTPINSYLSEANASVPLDRAGPYYFICGYASHCVANMKLQLYSLAPGQVAPPISSPAASGPSVGVGPAASADGKSAASSVRSYTAIMVGALLIGIAFI